MNWNARHNQLISRHIDVALVYQDMLGLDEALAYLERADVPKEIAERVLIAGKRRRPPVMPALHEWTPAPQVQCRRRNRVHDAIVEAALKLEKKCGAEQALALLKSEDVPDTVAARVFGPGPRQLRATSRLRAAGETGQGAAARV